MSLAVVVVVCAALTARSAAGQAGARKQATRGAATYLDSIPAWMAASHVPGLALGLVNHGKVSETRVFGSMRHGVPLKTSALFNVASLTKPVVAVTTLKLVSTGSLDLDESLAPYWVDPDIADDTTYKLITTRLILSHQTGFPNWRWLTPSRKLQFLTPPGKKFFYSGEGFEYLREALERKYYTSLQHLADSLLFQKAGMRETTFGWNPTADSTRFVTGYDASGAELTRPKRGMDKANAADWLVTTIGDYSRFAQYVLAGAGLSKPVLAAMTTPQVKFAEGSNESMGLGFEVMRGPATDRKILLHTGADDGIKTLIVLLPQSQRGVVVFTNGDRGMEVIVKILKAQLGLTELTP
ncbi:MAG: serine hydrolase domain-containing protein [Gemmatimonadaceae bacterium]